jgi:hypothetical protein
MKLFGRGSYFARRADDALTSRADRGRLLVMSVSAQPSPPATLRWLADHARFPASRLPSRAELLLLVAAAAGDAAEAGASANALRWEGAGPAPALRAHKLRRSQAHFKCDNSVNV